MKAVARSIESVRDALAPGGYFMLDINTRQGLAKTVETNELHDSDREIVMRKRIYDGERVVLYASGCFFHCGTWHRYRETIFKIVIDTDELGQVFADQGWGSFTYTTPGFRDPANDPEASDVAYLVARKAE